MATRNVVRWGMAALLLAAFGAFGAGRAAAQEEEPPKKPAKGKKAPPKSMDEPEAKPGDKPPPGEKSPGGEKPSVDQKVLDKLKRDAEKAFAKGKKDTVWIVAFDETVIARLTLGDDGKARGGPNAPNVQLPIPGFGGFNSKKAVAYEDRDKAIDDVLKFMTEFPQPGKGKKPPKPKKGAPPPDSYPPLRDWSVLKVLSGKQQAAFKDQALETYNAQFKAKNATPPAP